MKNKIIISFYVANIIMVLACFTKSSAQTFDFWELYGSANPTLRNVLSYNGTIINEFSIATNQNTRLRLHGNGQWQINAWSGAGGYISEPNGQANYATVRIRGMGTSGLVSYSFQNNDWGQNIQSYVGRPYTVSYVVKWNGKDRFYVAGQGWLYANGAWFSSDRELKEKITPLKNSLSRVLKLNGYSYYFKEEKRSIDCDSATTTGIEHRKEIGLIADEVERIVPEVVRKVDGGNKAIAYQNLVALLIEAVKEQQAQIKELQRKFAIEKGKR